jgi:hypothetical protein
MCICASVVVVRDIYSGTRPKDKKKRGEEKTKEKKCQRLCKRHSIQL